MKTTSPVSRLSTFAFVALFAMACSATQELPNAEPAHEDTVATTETAAAMPAEEEAAEGEVVEEEEELVGLIWLAKEFFDRGVMVTEYGPIATRLPAETTNRFLLDGRDVIDVYVFRNEDVAHVEAKHLAGRFNRRDVYQQGDVVVVRRTRYDSAITGTLHDILGRVI